MKYRFFLFFLILINLNNLFSVEITEEMSKVHGLHTLPMPLMNFIDPSSNNSKSLLEKLKETLDKEKVVILKGETGVGKSSLALHYFWQSIDKNNKLFCPYKLIHMFYRIKKLPLDLEFLSLGYDLLYSDLFPNKEVPNDFFTKVREINQFIDDPMNGYFPYLLLFDDFQFNKLLPDILPQNGHIIVTTRSDREWPYPTIEMSCWTEKEILQIYEELINTKDLADQKKTESNPLESLIIETKKIKIQENQALKETYPKDSPFQKYSKEELIKAFKVKLPIVNFIKLRAQGANVEFHMRGALAIWSLKCHEYYSIYDLKDFYLEENLVLNIQSLFPNSWAILKIDNLAEIKGKIIMTKGNLALMTYKGIIFYPTSRLMTHSLIISTQKFKFVDNNLILRNHSIKSLWANIVILPNTGLTFKSQKTLFFNSNHLSIWPDIKCSGGNMLTSWSSKTITLIPYSDNFLVDVIGDDKKELSNVDIVLMSKFTKGLENALKYNNIINSRKNTSLIADNRFGKVSQYKKYFAQVPSQATLEEIKNYPISWFVRREYLISKYNITFEHKLKIPTNSSSNFLGSIDLSY